MSLPYKTIKVAKPGTSGGNKPYSRASVIIQSTVTPEEFLIKFAKTVRFSRADIVYLTYSLKAFLLEELQKGNIVQTEFGTFSPVLNNPKNSDRGPAPGDQPIAGINYRPSPEMKKEIKLWDVKKI